MNEDGLLCNATICCALEIEMKNTTAETCVPIDISDADIYEAMSDIPGYLDITPGDFKEVYLRAYQHAIQRLTRTVRVTEIMTRDVAYVLRATPVREVAELMAKRKISGVPVVEAGGSVAGVISHRDFLEAMGGSKFGTFMEIIADCLRGSGCLSVEVRTQRAEDIMTCPAITATQETTVMEVADMMARRGINRIPVVDDKGLLTGIVSRADVVRSTVLG
ncbi:MAG: rane protein [Thermodesulfobacteriota bacterium]|nr:rane protein [Thermodesulfobacteriota bacterium]